MIEFEEVPLYEKEIHFNEKTHEKVFLTVNTFRGVEYLHLRKYYQDFDEEWKPTTDGVAIQLDFDNSRNLFEGLVEILSLAETKDILETHFKDLLDKIYLE